MKRIINIGIFLTLFCLKSIACLNYYVLDSSGRKHLHDDYPPSNIFIFSKYEIENLRKIENQISSITPAEKHKYISNYCASLIKLGRYKETIGILENLLKDRPDEYEINANLAVAYELDGQIEMALSCLQKSMRINPDSHRESEWFHLRILEAALNLRDNKIDLQKTNVLKIQNDTSSIIGVQISYQLKERVPLTKSSNMLLCKVLEECGDYYMANISLEWGIELYAIAIGYSADSTVITRLWKKINLSRQKLVELSSQGKEGSVSKYLYKSNWRKKIYQLSEKWDNYQPYYYDKEIIKSF